MDTPAKNTPVRIAIEIAINLLLIFVILAWCLRLLSPFLSLIVWAAVIAISLYKPFLKLQALLGGRKKLALILFTVMGLTVILVPSWLFIGSILDSGKEITTALETGEFDIAPPNESVKDWPVIGGKVYEGWSEAATNFEGWLEEHHETVKSVLGGLVSRVAGITVSALQFIISLLIATAFLANAETIVGGLRILFNRIVGERAEGFMKLSSATVTSIAVGVLGIAFIQAFLGGFGMMAVGVPAAGLITLILLITSIAQLPGWLIMFPVIGYVFSVESTVTASIFAVYGVFVAFLDVALKPVLMGRGVDAPMLVILLGAIGGLITSGIIGLFIGAVVLALGYKLFEAWLKLNDEEEVADKDREA